MADHIVAVPRTQFERDRVVAELRAAGCQVVEGPGSVDETQELARVHAIIAPPETPLTARQIGLAPHLRVVASPVIGVDHLDLEALADRDIRVVHGAAPQNYAGMAEAAVGLMVALTHRFGQKERSLRTGSSWTGSPGALLWGRTVGLLGGGRIGTAIADRLAGWGCEVLVCDPALRDDDGSGPGWRVVDRCALFAESDVVSVQVVLTDSTRGLVGPEEIRAMRRGGWLVNIGRGGVVDEAAVAAALATGHLAGAAFDVWTSEPPPPDHPLLAAGLNVIATPHNAGHSQEAYDHLADLAVRQTLDVLRGGPGVYLLR